MCFLGVIWGKGGKKTRNPPRRSVTVSGVGHNSPREAGILRIGVSTAGEQRQAPFSTSARLPARPPASALLPVPSRQAKALPRARLPRVPPLSHPSRRPRSEKLTPEVPGKAGVGGTGASVRPGAGLRSPAPSGAPTGSSYSCSLTLPPSLSQVARSVPVTWAGSRMVPHGRAPCALRRGSKRH